MKRVRILRSTRNTNINNKKTKQNIRVLALTEG